jgi:hypothetical protein
MEKIIGHDIDDIERLCEELREGHLDDDDFRNEVLMALGYSKEIIDGQQEIEELKALWDQD